MFPPCHQNPIGEPSSLYSPAFPFNTVRVITPLPGSRDSTQTASPNFALFDNFGLLRSRTPSQEWDNFSEEPSFHSDQEWERQRLPTSTDNNILDERFSDVNLDTSSSDLESGIMDDLNRELTRIGNLRSNLLRRMTMFTPEDVVENTLDEVKDELQSIHIFLDEYSNNVEAVIDSSKDDMGVDLVKKYEDDLVYVMREVKQHKRKILDKKKEISPPSIPLSAYETEMLQLQMKSLKLQETAQAKAESDKKETATVLIETKSNEFYGETSVMGDLLLDENWELADNTVVSQGMRLLSTWQAQMNIIERKYRDYENDALLYSFPQSKTDTVDAEYSRIRAKFEAVKEAVTLQDKDRGLFTLEPAKTEKVKWPMYYGNPAEDFMKWKEKMELAFMKNRVPMDERLDKLREFLRGKALALVPESTKNIEAAFKVLKEAFGDPARVLDHKLKILDDFGPYPSDKVGRGLPGYGKQVDWLLKVEGLIRDIIELGEKYSELDRDAFSTATIRKILERFPERMVAKFNRLKGDGKAKLKGFQTLLEDRRVEVQGLDITYGGHAASASGGGGGHGGGHSGGGNARKVEKEVANAAIRYDASVYFKEPEHFKDCRICNTLTTEGETRGLFTNHLSNYATGCPAFIKMTAEKRKDIAVKAHFCVRCFHPEIVWSKSHDKECMFGSGKRKNAYSCTNMSCKEHLWLCLTHRNQNKKAMDKFKEDLAKRGLRLSYIAAQAPLMNRTTAGQTTPGCGQCKDIVAGAIKKLKKKIKPPTEVIDIPTGDPMFMFFGIKGKTRSLNTFFDRGCSHCVMREGVPGEELKGTLVQEGPFDIGGVGGARVQANSEWVVLLDREDGRKQVVQGLTVDKVTSDFPMVSLLEAVTDVKNDAPGNSVLQKSSLPPAVGGSVDILMGIMYSSIFPVPIHSLESGLTIYQSKLSPHNKGFNAVIGGPHSSFSILAEKAGGTASLLAHFTEGLQAFRRCDGAPRIKNYYIMDSMTQDESGVYSMLDICKEYTGDAEVDLVTDDEDSIVDEEDSIVVHEDSIVDEEDSIVADVEGSIVTEGYCSGATPVNNNLCQHCPHSSTGHTAADERISALKKNLDIQGAGLEIEYRCVRCRDCQQCKNADQTEKISLREEAEMVEIKNSVRLDLKNKKIQCTLPLRGKEEDFLSPNRDRCVKVLDQQCTKYFHDDQTREAIVAAFKKLFDNGHIVKLDDLSEEQKTKFLYKPTQHHIPWRVVFKESPTTPARPVLDASSGTRKREGGKGGRCLNDLVCKGKVETLHLVNLLLRFLVGQHALTGDLTQFYNACKLAAHQWNLQRLLYRENLDPNLPIIEYIIITLIYGVKCVSAQTEYAMTLLADLIRQEYPELADFIVKSRYVDDLAESKATKELCDKLISDAEVNFDKIGLKCKAWTQSGFAPTEKASVDGISVMVGGVRWFPEIDAVETRIPLLHFSKKKRGKLPENTVFFDGTMMKIEDFVPKKLSRRQAASKLASVFDILGLLAPILSGLKGDLSKVVPQHFGLG